MQHAMHTRAVPMQSACAAASAANSLAVSDPTMTRARNSHNAAHCSYLRERDCGAHAAHAARAGHGAHPPHAARACVAKAVTASNDIGITRLGEPRGERPRARSAYPALSPTNPCILTLHCVEPAPIVSPHAKALKASTPATPAAGPSTAHYHTRSKSRALQSGRSAQLRRHDGHSTAHSHSHSMPKREGEHVQLPRQSSRRKPPPPRRQSWSGKRAAPDSGTKFQYYI